MTGMPAEGPVTGQPADLISLSQSGDSISGIGETFQHDLYIDLSSIADLLVQIDYTALADADYGALVTRQLNPNPDRNSDCVFNLARDFPDQWYELNNPDPAASERATTLTLAPNDFPWPCLLTTQVALGLSSPGPARRRRSRCRSPRPRKRKHRRSRSNRQHGIAGTRRGAPA